jgi:hypothetical protein
MSTFNEVFCAKLYEKGQEITAASLKGDPGNVLSSDITIGEVGDDGVLKMVEIVTTVLDTSVIIPNPLNTEASVYRIRKPEFTNNDLLVIDHNAIEFTKMYKEFAQTLTLYKRDNEWVL